VPQKINKRKRTNHGSFEEQTMADYILKPLCTIKRNGLMIPSTTRIISKALG
jgi:hypothetical protein